MAAVEVLEKGIDTLNSAGLSDYYLNFDLARMYAENRIEGKEALITSLVYEVLQHITYQNQPDLLQRFVEVVYFNLNESERDQIKKARNKKPGEPVQTLYNFLRREDPNPDGGVRPCRSRRFGAGDRGSRQADERESCGPGAAADADRAVHRPARSVH